MATYYAEYGAKYYKRNKDRLRASAKIRRDRVRRERLLSLDWYKSTHPCVDCGTSDPRLLEFDHVPERGKRLASPTDGRLTGGTLAALWAEVQKCDVACANCHKLRTHFRKQNRRRVRDCTFIGCPC